MGKARPARAASASLADAITLLISIRLYAMGIEDQKEEREVLESIFPDEITGGAFLRNIFLLYTDTPQMFPRQSSESQ